MRKIFLLALSIVFVLSANASAISIGGHDYELLTGVDPYSSSAPTYTVGTDLGYYLWAKDENRRDWSLRWTGDGALYNFSGNVALSANNFDQVSTFSFETSGIYVDHLIYNEDMDKLLYFAYANVGEDGFDFSIVGDTFPSYLGFNLNIAKLDANGQIISDVTDFIFIGADKVNPTSGDFALAAPVSEPRTLFLLGAGVVGLALYRRRSMSK